MGRGHEEDGELGGRGEEVILRTDEREQRSRFDAIELKGRERRIKKKTHFQQPQIPHPSTFQSVSQPTHSCQSKPDPKRSSSPSARRATQHAHQPQHRIDPQIRRHLHQHDDRTAEEDRGREDEEVDVDEEGNEGGEEGEMREEEEEILEEGLRQIEGKVKSWKREFVDE